MYLLPAPSVTSIDRTSLHPSISSAQIDLLVDRFYGLVLRDPRLGPIFEPIICARLDQHLATMKRFWRSVLLRSGEYKGKPVPVHAQIEGIETEDFTRWLTLFEQTAREVLAADAAPLVCAAAERIATSLWLARNQDPFASPPIWQTVRVDHSATSLERK